MLLWYLNQLRIQIGTHYIFQNCGVPQGGVISPFLWLLYMNDLLNLLTHRYGLEAVMAFADDLLIALMDDGNIKELVKIVETWAN